MGLKGHVAVFGPRPAKACQMRYRPQDRFAPQSKCTKFDPE
jgi:hypothetical protein